MTCHGGRGCDSSRGGVVYNGTIAGATCMEVLKWGAAQHDLAICSLNLTLPAHDNTSLPDLTHIDGMLVEGERYIPVHFSHPHATPLRPSSHPHH